MRINYRELKERIRLKDLLTRIGWKSIEGCGEQLRGPCPLPGCRSRTSDERADADRAFSVHMGKDVYQCFRCRSTDSVLDFWRTYRATNLYDAAIELYQILETSNQTPALHQPPNSQHSPSHPAKLADS